MQVEPLDIDGLFWLVDKPVEGVVTTKRTSDDGIDGRLYFDLLAEDRPFADDLQSMVIEVKGGANVGIGIVRGVLEHDTALMAGLIIMEPLSQQKQRNFEREMAQASDLEVRGVPYQCMQLLTMPDILAERRFKTPGVFGRHTLEPRLPGVE